LPSGFWVLNNRTLPLTGEFAVEIQLLALRLFFRKSGRDDRVDASGEAIRAVGGLLGALVILASSNELSLDVLFVAKALPGGSFRF
jgi:hypothetical protein